MEISSTQAATLLGGVSRTTINTWVDDGTLKGYRQGPRGWIRIDVNDLREFAQKYNYPFDEDLAAQLSREE